MCVWGRGSSDRGSSLSPIIGISFGAFGQELFSSKIHPTLWNTCHHFSLQNEQRCAYDWYSESSKILCSSRSTWIVNPASINALVFLGERAARRSNTFFSQRSQRCWDMEAEMRRKNPARSDSRILKDVSHDEISTWERARDYVEKRRPKSSSSLPFLFLFPYEHPTERKWFCTPRSCGLNAAAMFRQKRLQIPRLFHGLS